MLHVTCHIHLLIIRKVLYKHDVNFSDEEFFFNSRTFQNYTRDGSYFE